MARMMINNANAHKIVAHTHIHAVGLLNMCIIQNMLSHIDGLRSLHHSRFSILFDFVLFLILFYFVFFSIDVRPLLQHSIVSNQQKQNDSLWYVDVSVICVFFLLILWFSSKMKCYFSSTQMDECVDTFPIHQNFARSLLLLHCVLHNDYIRYAHQIQCKIGDCECVCVRVCVVCCRCCRSHSLNSLIAL